MAAGGPAPGPRRLAIAIPAYNAAETLAGVFDRIPSEIVARTAHYVVVDDGSTDATAAVARRLRARFPTLDLVEHPQNRGYGGAAQKSGFSRALALGADLVVWLHGDGQYAPESIPELLAPLDAGRADIVQGSRFRAGGALHGGMPVYKYVANRGLTWMENRVFGLGLAEYPQRLHAVRPRGARARSVPELHDARVRLRPGDARGGPHPGPPRRRPADPHALRGRAVVPPGRSRTASPCSKLMGRYLRGDYHRLVGRGPSLLGSASGRRRLVRAGIPGSAPAARGVHKR